MSFSVVGEVPFEGPGVEEESAAILSEDDIVNLSLARVIICGMHNYELVVAIRHPQNTATISPVNFFAPASTLSSMHDVHELLR